MNRDRINKLFSRLPTHVIIIFTLLVWVIPTVGLFITSLRPVQDINKTGWWTVFSPVNASSPYATFCSSCHGSQGRDLPNADLTNPEIIGKYPRSLQLLAMLNKPINGQPHMGDIPLPSPQEAAEIAAYLKDPAADRKSVV